MRILSILTVVIALTAIAAAPVQATPMQAATAGANYMVTAQLADGGWAWENGGTSASNITGASGLSLVRYYNAVGDASTINAAMDAGDYIVNHTYENGEPRFATADPYYCWQLSVAAGDATWSNHTATMFFDTLAAGTYTPNDWTTDGYIDAVQAARQGAWHNLLPWEFSTIPVTAAALGYPEQEATFRAALLEGLDTLDNSNPDSVYNDILGIAGGVRGLALDNVLSFDPISSPLHAGINGISTLGDLADYLAGLQNTDGSWYWHSDPSTFEEGNKDTQNTSYAVLALEAAATAMSTHDYDNAILSGRLWLETMQDSTTGAFWGYPGNSGAFNNEISGEATAALVPEPATFGLCLIGGLALLRRRR